MNEDSARGDLYRKNGELILDGCGLAETAREYGTPLYIYSEGRIRENYRRYADAFGFMKTDICYAVKANSNPEIISLLASLGAGADVVSGGELFMAVKAGVDPEKIVFSGVGKSEEEIRQAVRSGIRMLNVESAQELEVIRKTAFDENTTAGISVRVNPDIDPLTHPKISTGIRESKFGIPRERALELYREAAAMYSVEIRGVHFHIGSQITDLEPFRLVAEASSEFVSELSGMGIKVKYVDIGGGLGIRYGSEDVPSPYEIAEVLKEHLADLPCSLILEPGRSIVGDAGYLISKILYVKKQEPKNFIIIDAGFNDLLRPAMYGSRHEVLPVTESGETVTADIAGPVCETGDVMARERTLKGAVPGNLIAICDAGAYGFSMASNYNSRPRPSEVMVQDGQVRLIRRRESYEDLIQAEL